LQEREVAKQILNQQLNEKEERKKGKRRMEEEYQQGIQFKVAECALKIR
jgi:hypothetical protein